MPCRRSFLVGVAPVDQTRFRRTSPTVGRIALDQVRQVRADPLLQAASQIPDRRQVGDPPVSGGYRAATGAAGITGGPADPQGRPGHRRSVSPGWSIGCWQPKSWRWCENVAGYYGSCRPAPKCRCGATPRMPAPTSGKRWSTPSRSGSVHLEGLMTTLAILVALIVLVRLTSLPNFLRFASLHPDQDEDDNGQREHECSDGRDATGLNCPRIVIPAVNGARIYNPPTREQFERRRSRRGQECE